MSSGSISMSSTKTAWKGRIDWQAQVDADAGKSYVSATLVTWKTDGMPSSPASGALFSATLQIGSSVKQFTFPQQNAQEMTIGSLEDVAVTGPTVTVSAQVIAPAGVSMAGYPLSGSQTLTLYEAPAAGASTLWTDAQEARMGKILALFLRTQTAGVTHTLKASFGSWSATLATGVGTSWNWQIPDLAAYCPNSTGGTVTLTCQTYKGSAKVGEVSRLKLPLSVPEATVPVSAASCNMGSSLAVALDRGSASFTHTLSYSFAGQTGTLAQKAAASVTWKVPLDLAKEIPAKTQDTCTLTCKTYNGTALVGTKTAKVTLKVPKTAATRPKVTMAIAPTALPEAFSGLYIRGVTGVRAEFTASSEYSQVASYSLSAGGAEASGNPARTAALAAAGEVTVTGTVTDQRGYSTSVKEVISVVSCEMPAVIPYPGQSAVVCARCHADGTPSPEGQSLLIRAGRRYTPIRTGGEQVNFCSLSWRLRAPGGEYGVWKTLLAADAGADTAELVAENALPEMKSGYAVQLRAMDTLGQQSVLTAQIGARSVSLHLGPGGSGVAVGKYCDSARGNAFEVALTTYLDTGIAPRPIFAGGLWEQGQVLGQVCPESDAQAAGAYTVFLALGQDGPRLLAAWGSVLTDGQIRITRDSDLTLTQTPTPLTALYALI